MGQRGRKYASTPTHGRRGHEAPIGTKGQPGIVAGQSRMAHGRTRIEAVNMRQPGNRTRRSLNQLEAGAGIGKLPASRCRSASRGVT